MDRHNAIIAKQKAKAKANGKPFVEDHTTVGDTSLHIFDGLLTMPMDIVIDGNGREHRFGAEDHAKELNRVFKKMMSAERGHASYVKDALTFELNSRGDKKRIPATRLKKLGLKKWDSYSALQRADMVYERLLKEEGKEMAAANGWSSWHEDLNEYAFDWTTDEAKEILTNLNFFDRKRKDNAARIKHVHQFFWGTRDLEDQLSSANKSRIDKHTKVRRKII